MCYLALVASRYPYYIVFSTTTVAIFSKKKIILELLLKSLMTDRKTNKHMSRLLDQVGKKHYNQSWNIFPIMYP